ncbi:hypothetical protein ACH5RR_030268 [Cinchona calisaya]|uniref:ascorbate ferrireductase (transmembrane) n=1 Tax=Cinchona calisaya TaxID=153742 RepID=A0ABD2YU48_9GENT
MTMVSVSFSSFFLIFFARLSAFIVALLLVIWALYFQTSFIPQSSSQEDLIYAVLHPLLMVIGFILVSGEAILVHRWLPGSRSLKKSVHLCLQGLALGCGIFGIWTKFHSQDGIVANFYSLHSWMGITCISLFGAQWLLGFLNFWHRREARTTRVRVLPWHVFLGLYTYALAVVTAETGLLEKLTLQTKGDVLKRSTESMVVNGLGLGLALLSGSVILAAVSPKHKATQAKIVPRNPSRPFSISASIAQKDPQFSWISSNQNGPDYYNGWAVVEAPVKPKKEIGATLVMIGVVVGVVAYILVSKKGFESRLRGSFSTMQGILSPSKTEVKVEAVYSDVLKEKVEGVSEGTQESGSDAVDENVLKESKQKVTRQNQHGRIIVPIAVDYTQKEALLLLKKLKIMEDDVKAAELCTRREYARWLVRANSQLERSHMHRIVSSAALSGSTIAAFDDVNVEDPDFVHIQCLAEAGIIPSKLLDGNYTSNLNDSEGQQGVFFSPESFVSRQDLICWKAKLEYGVMLGTNDEISRKNIGFLDARDISSEAIVHLFMDVLADEKSILRRVFGQIKRFQARKPSTHAQAAVALTSGRMREFLRAELSRLEAENASRQTAMQEIRSELLDRGDIQRFWDRKMEEERKRGLEVEKAYLSAIHDVEQEKAVKENGLPELLKQRATLDCQKQLLSSLKEEVDEMSERLLFERGKYMEEKGDLEAVLSDLRVKYEGLLDAKSILEAETEALRILKSWIDDEARKSQAQAKVLEEVGQRWNGHTKDYCYELIGYPLDWNTRSCGRGCGRDAQGAAHTTTTGGVATGRVPNIMQQQPIGMSSNKVPGLLSEQIKQLLQLLGNDKKLSTSAKANFVGPCSEEID